MNKRIYSLNGLRFLFMIFLFLHHLDAFSDLNIPGYWSIMRILGEGYISVDFFFILSGFLLTYSYMIRMQSGEITSSTFLVNRFAKLWPSHALIWVIVIILYSGEMQNFIMNVRQPQFWVGFFLMQSFIPVDYYAMWGNAVAWTMSTLLFFYFAFCFLVKMTRRQRSAIFWALCGIIFLNCIVIGNNTPVSIWLYVNNPIFRLPEFLGGMLLGEWMQEKGFSVLKSYANMLQIVSLLVMACFIGFSACYVAQLNPRFQSLYYFIPCALLISAFSLRGGYFFAFFSKVIANFGGLFFRFLLSASACSSNDKTLL